MTESTQTEAMAFLRALLTAQPHLLAPCEPSKENGEKVAEFMSAFIRRFSELQDRMKPGAPGSPIADRRTKPR